MSSPEINRGPDKGVFKMVTGDATRAGSPPLTTSDRQPRVKTKQPGESGLSRTAKIALGLAIVGTEVGGVAIDQKIDNEPATLKNIAVQSVTWPWDLGKTTVEDIGRFFGKETVSPIFNSNADTQIVKAGPDGNAKAATPEQIREFLNRTPPIFEKPKVGEQAPSIQIIMSLNPESAKEIKFHNESLKTEYFNGHIPHFYISGDNVPFYVPIVEGAKKVNVKTSINKSGISAIELRYTLNDGQIINTSIDFWDRNIIPTDILKNIPVYDANVLLTKEKIDASPTKEFDLSQDPLIDLFHISGSSHISLAITNESPTDSYNQFGLNSSFAKDGVMIMYAPSTK